MDTFQGLWFGVPVGKRFLEASTRSEDVWWETESQLIEQQAVHKFTAMSPCKHGARGCA